MLWSTIVCRNCLKLVDRYHRSILKAPARTLVSESSLVHFWDESVNGSDSTVVRLKDGILKGKRASLAESITLMESTHPLRKSQSEYLLRELLKNKSYGDSEKFRIAISGSPGVGKSSFIEAFGLYLTNIQKLKVAVLTIDPSSATSGGSILGDQTRMTELSRDENAYIRTSPTRGRLGGVAKGTREAIFLCEATGFDVTIVETVGVGQSEIEVADMVDMFVLLLSPAHGDELQGMKRGIVEFTDLILITKSDGDLKSQANRTQAEYISALKFMRSRFRNVWKPKVLQVSAHTNNGIDKSWSEIVKFKQSMIDSCEFNKQRKKQLENWLWSEIESYLFKMFKTHPNVLKEVRKLEIDLTHSKTTPGLAAHLILKSFMEKL